MLVLSDIDGVIADPCHLVKVYLSGSVKNWKGYYKHTLDIPPIPGMIDVMNGLALWGTHSVKFCTGRNESNRQMTQEWLNTHLQWWIPDDNLLMRPNGDHSPSSVLKLRWALDLHPELIFEDEPETVEALRDKGFTVVQIHGHRVSSDDHRDNIPD